MKPIGYFVMESDQDFEQALGLDVADHLPPGGILNWTKGASAMFSDRQAARAAITRTEHYRLAFGRADLPERRLCSIKPVVAAASAPGGNS